MWLLLNVQAADIMDYLQADPSAFPAPWSDGYELKYTRPDPAQYPRNDAGNILATDGSGEVRYELSDENNWFYDAKDGKMTGFALDDQGDLVEWPFDGIMVRSAFFLCYFSCFWFVSRTVVVAATVGDSVRKRCVASWRAWRC